MMKITARDVAEHLGCDYVVASGLLTVLVDKGIIKHAENRKHSSGKGKPTRVFEVERILAVRDWMQRASMTQLCGNPKT